jgi:hypothetical protein
MELSKILEEHGIPAAMKAACEAFSDVIGPPAKATGQLLASPIHMMQAELFLRFVPRYKRLVKQAGISERQVPFRIWFPILQSASIEEDNSMQETWAALLANAANPRSNVEVTTAFVEVLKQISPLEGKLLHFAYSELAPECVWLSKLDEHFQMTPQQAWVSLENLNRLGVLGDNLPEVTNQNLDSARKTAYYEKTVFGQAFVDACSAPSSEANRGPE